MGKAAKREVPSRQWSSSELKDANKGLLAVKREGISQEELIKQIQEPIGLSSVSNNF